MKNELKVIRKLNMFKVLITATIAFVLLVLIIIVSYKNVIKGRLKREANKYASIIYQKSQNEIAEENEKKQREEELFSKRYSKLNEEDFEKVSKIYSHSEPKRVFLTFDDGPSKAVTPYILDLLKKENVKANFFLLGSRVEENPKLVKREFDEGHFIGNHGYTHKYSSIYSSVDSVFDEYNRTNDLIKKAVGNDKVESLIFRFPGGLVGGPYNDLKMEAAAKLKENGIANVDWNALTSDADNAKTKEAIMKSFYKTIENETSIVLLMHDAPDKILTYETLPDIIKYLKDNGYEFKTMYDMLER